MMSHLKGSGKGIGNIGPLVTDWSTLMRKGGFSGDLEFAIFLLDLARAKLDGMNSKDTGVQCQLPIEDNYQPQPYRECSCHCETDGITEFQELVKRVKRRRQYKEARLSNKLEELKRRKELAVSRLAGQIQPGALHPIDGAKETLEDSRKMFYIVYANSEKKDEEVLAPNEIRFKMDDIVWVQLEDFPLLPGRLTASDLVPPNPDDLYIFIFGTDDYLWVAREDVTPFHINTAANKAATVEAGFGEAITAVEEAIADGSVSVEPESADNSSLQESSVERPAGAENGKRTIYLVKAKAGRNRTSKAPEQNIRLPLLKEGKFQNFKLISLVKSNDDHQPSTAVSENGSTQGLQLPGSKEEETVDQEPSIVQIPLEQLDNMAPPMQNLQEFDFQVPVRQSNTTARSEKLKIKPFKMAAPRRKYKMAASGKKLTGIGMLRNKVAEINERLTCLVCSKYFPTEEMLSNHLTIDHFNWLDKDDEPLAKKAKNKSIESNSEKGMPVMSDKTEPSVDLAVENRMMCDSSPVKKQKSNVEVMDDCVEFSARPVKVYTAKRKVVNQ